MIKFIVKIVIVLLALQAAMDYLRKADMMEGSIHINYPVVKQELITAILTKKVASNMVQSITHSVRQVVTTVHCV